MKRWMIISIISVVLVLFSLAASSAKSEAAQLPTRSTSSTIAHQLSAWDIEDAIPDVHQGFVLSRASAGSVCGDLTGDSLVNIYDVIIILQIAVGMIEPTETESKATLDAFIEAMKSIAQEAEDHPEHLQTAPHTTAFGRLDEVQAAKELVLCCRPAELSTAET